MGDLAVSVRLHGELVEDRVLTVNRLVRLGERPDALIAFPGADITVVRLGQRLALRGRDLEEGDDIRITLGPVEVQLEHTVRASLPSEWKGTFDVRFLGIVLLIVAGASWADAASWWWSTQPLPRGQFAERIARFLESEPSSGASARLGRLGNEEEEAPATTPVETQGPLHLPDDLQSQVGWYRWYRQIVPTNVEARQAAELRLLSDPLDPGAHRVLALAAYDRDDFESAVDEWLWIVQRWPEDREALFRLALAAQRLGRHRTEVTLYRQILAVDEKNLGAQAGLAVALTRLNQLDAATLEIEELHQLAPDSPLTWMALAKIDGMQGREEEALEALDRAISGRARLSAEAQVELRRDLALDPAFSHVRKDRRLLSMLHRHLGAAGPRILRRPRSAPTE